MSKQFVFNFPLTKFACNLSSGCTWRGQADQITQEAAEAFSAAERGDEQEYLVELLDCIHACETALAEFDDAAIGEAWRKVVDKNARRGYYDESAMLEFVQENVSDDQIDHPRHYTRGAIESIEVIEPIIDGLEGKQASNLANVLKYALRAGKKGDAGTDLEKANNYAHRLCTGEWRWQHGQA